MKDRNRIMIVDDAELNRELLQEILQGVYEVELAEDGEVAINMLRDHHNTVVALLLDLQMPNRDGYEVINEMKVNGWMEKIPVLIISGEHSIEAENRCFEMGVSDFIHKPFDVTLVINRVRNVVALFQYKNELEERVEKQTEVLSKQFQLLMAQAKKLKERNEKIVDILGNVVECRNLESGEHIKRVKGFTRILAQQLMADYPGYQLTESKIDVIVAASSLHDIGKIAIPDSILLKPGKLTNEEFEEMKTHTTQGCEIINHIEGVWDDDYREVSYDICRHHHERYDGGGYPDGLKGDVIPIAAQIVSVADVYDALVCERVYKDAFLPEQAFQMIMNGECGVFSPKILDCFQKSREKFEKLAAELA